MHGPGPFDQNLRSNNQLRSHYTAAEIIYSLLRWVLYAQHCDLVLFRPGPLSRLEIIMHMVRGKSSMMLWV